MLIGTSIVMAHSRRVNSCNPILHWRRGLQLLVWLVSRPKGHQRRLAMQHATVASQILLLTTICTQAVISSYRMPTEWNWCLRVINGVRARPTRYSGVLLWPRLLSRGWNLIDWLQLPDFSWARANPQILFAIIKYSALTLVKLCWM